MRVLPSAIRARRRGTTLVETLLAMTGAVMIGGSFLGLISAMSQAYQARTAMSELSGYIDIAMFNLKRDIWKSVLAQPIPSTCPNKPQPGWTDWLALQADPAGFGVGEDVCYMLDQTTANVRLVRWRWSGVAWQGQWVVAQRLVVANTTANITADKTGVQIKLQTSRTALGRSFSRTEPPTTYRFQRPCPAAGACTP